MSGQVSAWCREQAAKWRQFAESGDHLARAQRLQMAERLEELARRLEPATETSD